MKDEVSFPNIPGYVDVKEAARILGVTENSVYRYIQAGRLPAYQAGHNLMIEQEALKRFKPGQTGRPRKKTSSWRASPDASLLLVTYIRVQIYDSQQAKLEKMLLTLRQKEKHLFPGTVARYISLDDTSPPSITIQLVWKNGDMLDKATRQQDLEAFKAELADVLNWETAQYSTGKAIIHT